MTTQQIHDNPDLAKAVHETATQKLNDPEWEPFPIDLVGGDLELGQRAFEVLQTLGYAKEPSGVNWPEVLETLGYAKEPSGVNWPEGMGMSTEPHYDTYYDDLIHPRAKEHLIKYGKDYVECLEAFMRLTNQPINRL
jgi:hypothetical protein